MSTRAERARAAAEEEKRRLDALQRKNELEAADVVTATSIPATAAASAGAQQNSQPPPTAAAPPAAWPPAHTIGLSADTPMLKKKVDRQGIDLRPLDRERWARFEMFCLQRRLKLGKKKGLTLYARAGLQLLDELLTKDEAAAERLLRSLGEGPTG